MNPMIGVVVPIYNVENYLRKCLDSILNQTYTNLQIVLINDGSTDKSLEIAKEYLQKDSRFILIDKENGGLSSARNVGIDFFKKHLSLKACDEERHRFKPVGENPCMIQSVSSLVHPSDLEEISYLFFIDSDDSIKLACLEAYLKSAQENSLEIVTSGVEYRSAKDEFLGSSYGTFVGCKKKNVLSGEEMLKQISSQFFCSAWNVLIDFNFLKRINLYFIHGILYEDCAFGTLLFLQARRVMLLDQFLYEYTIRTGSIMHPIKMTEERRLLDFESWYAIIRALEDFPMGQGITHQHIINCYLQMLYLCAFELKENREKYLNRCKEFQYMSPRIFLARYFSRTFLFLRRIKRIYRRIFKVL